MKTHFSKNSIAALALCAAACGVSLAAQAVTVEISPAQPSFGQVVNILVSDTQFPIYLPASSFTRVGNTINVYQSYSSNAIDSRTPSYASKSLRIGELVPGTYTVVVRLSDLNQPSTPVQTTTSGFVVTPPAPAGAFSVPVFPQAYQALSIVIRSQWYMDPASVTATRNGGVIRVDYDYAPDAPSTGPAPAGLAVQGSVALDGLPSGRYVVEAYGRSRNSSFVEKFFTREVSVDAQMGVVEYYHDQLRHYFMAGGPDEVKLLDNGAQGGWKRTGQLLEAWLKQSEAPPTAKPVCRFYASGPNSHFFTLDASECDSLKSLEITQRSQAVAANKPFTGWAYEGIGFWAIGPQSGQCPLDTDPVYRTYNNRAAQNDSNHRFTHDLQLRAAMVEVWKDEGIQMCSLRIQL